MVFIIENFFLIKFLVKIEYFEKCINCAKHFWYFWTKIYLCTSRGFLLVRISIHYITYSTSFVAYSWEQSSQYCVIYEYTWNIWLFGECESGVALTIVKGFLCNHCSYSLILEKSVHNNDFHFCSRFYSVGESNIPNEKLNSKTNTLKH
jgi:hypothetical protein